MNAVTKSLGLAALAIAVLSQGGCLVVAAGAGAGTYAYVTGVLKSDLEHDLADVYDASQKAMKALEFAEGNKAKDALQALVEAKMADGTNVTIKLKKKTESTTEVSIRVGTFGDEKKSIMILDEIKKAL